jgi:esterase/lipase superfamily enzyme
MSPIHYVLNIITWAALTANFLRLDCCVQGVKLVVVAHSMGNEALTQALEGIQFTNAQQLVFAAPDVSQDDFKRRLGKGDRENGHFTLYCRKDDWALWVSRLLNSNTPSWGLGRAGDSSVRLCREPGLFDTIDCSPVARSPNDPYGHGYVTKDPNVAGDVRRVALGDPIDQRIENPRTLEAICLYYIYPNQQQPEPQP